jgi:hypothetical protein
MAMIICQFGHFHQQEHLVTQRHLLHLEFIQSYENAAAAFLKESLQQPGRHNVCYGKIWLFSRYPDVSISRFFWVSPLDHQITRFFRFPDKPTPRSTDSSQCQYLGVTTPPLRRRSDTTVAA